MYICIKITSSLEVKTGMHIGASSEFSEIGAVDSPIIKDPLTEKPIIPGSTLKGKIRTLLARKYNNEISEVDKDTEKIKRLFGNSSSDTINHSRVIFYDSFIKKENDENNNLTEVKFENTIKRISLEANPRQIERVVRGTEFDINIVYEHYGKDAEISEVLDDLELLIDGINLLEYNYLGGNGSRGYGQVKFSDKIEGEIVEYLDDKKEKIKKIKEEIEEIKKIKKINLWERFEFK